MQNMLSCDIMPTILGRSKASITTIHLPRQAIQNRKLLTVSSDLPNPCYSSRELQTPEQSERNQHISTDFEEVITRHAQQDKLTHGTQTEVTASWVPHDLTPIHTMVIGSQASPKSNNTHISSSGLSRHTWHSIRCYRALGFP